MRRAQPNIVHQIRELHGLIRHHVFYSTQHEIPNTTPLNPLHNPLTFQPPNVSYFHPQPTRLIYLGGSGILSVIPQYLFPMRRVTPPLCFLLINRLHTQTVGQCLCCYTRTHASLESKTIVYESLESTRVTKPVTLGEVG